MKSHTPQKDHRLDIIDVDDYTCADIRARDMHELAKKQNMRHLGYKLKSRGHGVNKKYTMPTEYVDNKTPNALNLKTPEIQKIVQRMDQVPWWQPELGQQVLEDFEYDYVVFSGLPGYDGEYVCLWDTDTDTPYVITSEYELWQLEPETYGIVDIYQDEIVKNCYIRIQKDIKDGVTSRPLHWDRVQWSFENHLKGRRG